LGDYRDVDGIKIAHHVLQNANGELSSDVSVTGITLNAELDASLFQEPE